MISSTTSGQHAGSPLSGAAGENGTHGRLDRLLSVEELGELLQVPVATIYQWRYRGEGPEAIRIGRYLRFDPKDVQQWIDDRKMVTPER